jgi:hypothetical protein
MRVPLLIISPYVRAHTVYHNVAQFGSVVRFIERRFGLASLGNRDAPGTNDLMDAFDFAQSPLSPVVRNERSCGSHVTFGFTRAAPLAADLTDLDRTAGGTNLLVQGTNGVRYTVRLKNIAQITRQGGQRATLADLNLGDRLHIVGQLDPTQAGYLIADSVHDQSITTLTGLQGTINYVNEARNLLTVDLVASPAPLLVLVTPRTAIILPNGHRGTIDNLRRGTLVKVSGTYDMSSRILTRATTVRVLPPGTPLTSVLSALPAA